MINLKENFSKSKLKENCICGQIESLEHIYSCKILNTEENGIPFEEIYSNNMKNQIEVLRKIEKSLENRNKNRVLVIETPCDPEGSATSLVALDK